MRDLLPEKVDVEKFLHQASVLRYFVKSFLFLCRIFQFYNSASFWWFFNVFWQIDQQVSVFLSREREDPSPSLVDLKLHWWADWTESPRPPSSLQSLHVLRKQENWQSFGNPDGARNRNNSQDKYLLVLLLKHSTNCNNSMSIRGKKTSSSQWEFYIMREVSSLLYYLPPRKC